MLKIKLVEMDGKFQVLTLDDATKWNDYHCQIPECQQDIYFSPQYYKLYQENGDGKACCFVFEQGSSLALYPFLINKIGDYFDIQGAYGYNGIISNDYRDKFTQDFEISFRSWIQENKIIAEFTRFHPLLNNSRFSQNITVIDDRKTVTLDLSRDIQEIWLESYSGVNRNMIRKAEKAGIRVEESDKMEDYDIFFSLYQNTMSNLNADKYLFFSKEYFRNFREYLRNNHTLLLAKIDNQVICAMILMHWGKYAHYHLSARDRNFSNSGVNNLILDKAIRKAKDLNCSKFHFGGGTSNSSSDSLLKFKQSFSKDLAQFSIGKRVWNNEVYQSIVTKWGNNNAEKANIYKNYLLKYRF